MTFLESITWAEIFLFAHTCTAPACTVRVLYKQHNIGTAFTWLTTLFLFPVFGTIGYLLVGKPWLGSARMEHMGEMDRFYSGFAEKYLREMYFDVGDKMKPHYYGISRVVTRSTGLGATQGSGVTLLVTADDIIDTMLADIETAEHSCPLTLYITEPQGRIEELLGTVLRAAERGVDCATLANAVGSSGSPGSTWTKELRDAGVEVHSALPMGPLRTLSTRSDLRNHRKIMVTDGKIGYTDNYNLIDPRFFKRGSDVGEQVDVMMHCTRPLMLGMSAVSFADLAVKTDENL